MNALVWMLTSVLCFALSAGLALASEPVPAVAKETAKETTNESAQPAPLDLNSAQRSQLEQLPGIGEKRAQAILDYREAHGGFHSVSQLLQIKGIGRAMLRKLRPLVTVVETSGGHTGGSPGTGSPLRVR